MVTLIKYGALSGGEKYNVNQMYIDGLSTDTKPTTTIDGMGIPNGSVFTEVDTGKTYMFDEVGKNWYEVSIGGGGGTSGGIILVGTTTTQLTDGATTNPITVDGQSYTAQPNDAVIYGNKEFLFDGTNWHEFGDLSGLSSNDIGSMTGYAKASSAAAISTSDTLNQAVGKLEKALDGKQATIDANNKLSSDLVDDTNKTNKFATQAQLDQIATNQTNISSFHKSDNTDIYFSETEPTGNITVGSYWISSHSTNIYIKTQNLAPPLSDWDDGYIDANGDLHSPSSTQQEKTTPYIAIDSTNYVCTSDFTEGTIGRWKCAAYYDENKTFISRATSYDNGAWSLTAPANAAFIRLSFRTYGENKEIMLNAGTVPLPYEPQYKWDTLGVQYNTYIKGVNHRGYNTVAPENTIPAYILSKKMGFDYVETDISFTSDGEAVLLHDNTIDRTSDGTGNISDMTYAQVSQYDFGSWKSAAYAGTKIPTFDEFIKFCRNVGLKVYAELKGSPTQTQVDNVCSIVKKYGMENNVSWIAFDSTALEKVLTDIPTARVGFIISTATSTAVTTIAALKTSDNSVFLDCSSITDSVISDAITALVPVELWTVNTIAGITSANGYISGFTSDTINASRIIADYALNQ